MNDFRVSRVGQDQDGRDDERAVSDHLQRTVVRSQVKENRHEGRFTDRQRQPSGVSGEGGATGQSR